VEKRVVRSKIYIEAFFISLAIFIAGLLIGYYLEKSSVSEIEERTKEIERSIRQAELEMLYFQTINASDCATLNEVVRRININLDELATKLASFSEDALLSKSLEELKEEYTYLLIKNWILVEKMKESCKSQIATILYFYKRKNCDDCLVQGNILSALKLKYKEKLMIFPLDSEVKVEMVKILMGKYNITSFPSIVVLGKKYEGIVSKEEVEKLILQQLS
jgi:hypothetical protein